jgi:hypothetical protein
LSPHDGGAYAKAFIEGADTHWRSAMALGLAAEGTERDEENKVHTAIREGAKRFRYAFLYGCQSTTAGRIICDTARSVQQLDSGSDLHQQFFGRAAHPGESALKQVGKKALKRFIDGSPGLGHLQGKLQKHVDKHDWLPGLDGRRVPVRALYTSLNYIVTSSEAIICKRWMIRVHDELCARFRYGWDGEAVIVLWVHDELVVCCRPEIAEQVGEIMVRHAREAGEFYNFRVPLDAGYKIGRSWAGEAVNGKVVEPRPAISLVLPTQPEQPAPEQDPVTTDPDLDEINDRLIRVGIEPITINAAFAAPPTGADVEAVNAGLSVWGIEPLIPAVAAPVSAPISPPTAPDPAPPDPPPRSSGNRHAGNGYEWGDDDGKPRRNRRVGRHIATYLYRDHLGRSHTCVEKWRAPGKRAQYPQSFWVDGHWLHSKPPGWRKIPYRLPELLAALAKSHNLDVHIPEGEKDADALVALGLTTTTSSEGATNPKSKKPGNWTPELNKWFYGVQRAFIPEDNDEPGRCFAREKARALDGIVPDIRIVSFPDVPEGEDVSYWLSELKHSKEDYLARCEAAPRWSGSALESVNAAAIEMESYDWLWPGRFAIGEIGLIVGMPDEGKGQKLAYIAARVTRGLEWPNNEGCAPQGNVLLLTAEDHIKRPLYRASWRQAPTAAASRFSKKNNLADAAQKRKSLAFHFDAKQVGTDPRNGKPIEAPFIVFEPGYVDVTASEALSAVNENKSPTILEDAKQFLRDMMVVGGGRAPRVDIEEAAEAEKISERTLRRAKTALKIRAEKDRTAADGKWYWVLPEKDNAAAGSGDDLLDGQEGF